MIKKFAGKKKGAPTGLGTLAAQPLTAIPPVTIGIGGNPKKPPADPTTKHDAPQGVAAGRKGAVSDSMDTDTSPNQRKNRQTMSPAISPAVLTMKKRFIGNKKGGK